MRLHRAPEPEVSFKQFLHRCLIFLSQSFPLLLLKDLKIQTDEDLRLSLLVNADIFNFNVSLYAIFYKKLSKLVKLVPQLPQKARLADSLRLLQALSNMFIIYSEVFSPPFVHSHHLHQKRARDCNYPMQFLAHFLELQGCWGGRSGSNDHVIEGRMRIEWIKLAVFDRYYIFFHLSIIKIIEGRHISGPNTQHFHPRSKEGRESTILRQQISESIRKEGDKITKVTGNW